MKTKPVDREGKHCRDCGKEATVFHEGKNNNRTYFCGDCIPAYDGVKKPGWGKPEKFNDHLTEADYETWMRL